jgi:hypothetical protein
MILGLPRGSAPCRLAGDFRVLLDFEALMDFEALLEFEALVDFEALSVGTAGIASGEQP